jgi:hypothetical protein
MGDRNALRSARHPLTDDLEAEIAEAAAHAIHDRVVLAWIARVQNEPIDRLSLDFK